MNLHSGPQSEHRAPHEGESGGELRRAIARRSSLLHTLRAVAWSFLGIRRSDGHAHDLGKLNPLHVIIVGVLAAAAFVVVLVLLAQWVVGSGVAG